MRVDIECDNRMAVARLRCMLHPIRYADGVLMSSRFNTFTCPNCVALYQIVKVEAGPETVFREIACCVCGGPLAPREGEFVLKYFLLRKAARRRRSTKVPLQATENTGVF
jgi:hypothetical protein